MLLFGILLRVNNENFTFHVVDIIIKYRQEQLRIGLIVSPCLTVDFSTV